MKRSGKGLVLGLALAITLTACGGEEPAEVDTSVESEELKESSEKTEKKDKEDKKESKKELLKKDTGTLYLVADKLTYRLEFHHVNKKVYPVDLKELKETKKDTFTLKLEDGEEINFDKKDIDQVNEEVAKVEKAIEEYKKEQESTKVTKPKSSTAKPKKESSSSSTKETVKSTEEKKPGNSTRDESSEVKPKESSGSAESSKDSYSYETEIETESIPFEYITEYSKDYKEGESVVSQYGRPGKRTIEYKVTYKDGEEVSREIVSDTSTDPVNQVTLLGSLTWVVDQEAWTEYVEEPVYEWVDTWFVEEYANGYDQPPTAYYTYYSSKEACDHYANSSVLNRWGTGPMEQIETGTTTKEIVHEEVGHWE